MEIAGEINSSIPAEGGSSAKAALGAVSCWALETTQFEMPLEEMTVVHPEGNALAASKFSAKAVTGAPNRKLKLMFPSTVGPSRSFRVGVIICPQLPSAVKLNARATAGPPPDKAP